MPPNLIHYIMFLLAFITAESLSMWGQYSTLKYPHMGMLEAFMRAIPFAWANWFFMTIAVGLGDKYNLVTPTQDTFLLIIVQFTLILLINHFYLKQPLFRSDIVTFLMILLGFYISFTQAASRLFNWPITKKKKKVKKPKRGGGGKVAA